MTGAEAKVLAEDCYPSAIRVHVVHVAPDEVEWWRANRADDAGLRADVRTRLELELGVDATLVLAVGPRLHRLLRRDLSVIPDAPEPVRFDPGFDLADGGPRVPTPGAPTQILLMGRLQDYEIKGVDLAAKALATALALRGPDAPDVELLVRGAPPGESGALRDKIHRWAGDTSLRVTARPFTVDAEHLRQDLMRATLVLMPSRAESFGLVGVEAITAGTPILVSDRSGLGLLLKEMLAPDEAARVVVPVHLREAEDVARWGHHIATVLDNPDAAFATTKPVRRRLAKERTWTDAARRILEVLT